MAIRNSQSSRKPDSGCCGNDRNKVTAKILSAILTLIAVAGSAAFLFIMLLVALNGFHGSDATYGVGAYTLLSVVNVMAMAAAAFFVAGFLIKREFKGWVAGLIAVPILTIVGVVLELVILFVSVLFTDIASKNF